MNATLQPASQPISPLLFAASEANLKSGSEMKLRWIGQVLSDMQRTNDQMGRRSGIAVRQATRTDRIPPSGD